MKFAIDTDDPDAGVVEYAYSLMAREAGIDMPVTRLFETSEGDRFFGIKRFDRGSAGESRVNNRRYHVQTFGNLIHSNFRIPSADYADLLKATSLLTRNHQDVLRAFRRMAFNVLAHNRDDHVKKFSYVMDDLSGDWSLSPAYDLLFTPGPGGEHTMTIAGEDRNPNRSHMLQLAKQADIPLRQAAEIIDEVHSAITHWPKHAAHATVTQSSMNQINKSLPKLI